jgi:outer membrane protein OmpA-like peptidoglycan-associated protein
MKNIVLGLGVVALALGSSTACATKKYVNTQISDVNSKVGALSTAVEETQQRTRENAQKIGEVDQKVGKVDEKVDVKTAAVQKSADEAMGAAKTVDAKVDKVDAANRKLVFEVVLRMDDTKGGNFAFGKAALPDGAKAELDKLVSEVSADPRNYFFEIEGHTDDRGEAVINERVGLERAESVKRYLYEAHSIPLHKINVISYGESKPLAPNKTKDGRSQNRRVLVRVLA